MWLLMSTIPKFQYLQIKAFAEPPCIDKKPGTKYTDWGRFGVFLGFSQIQKLIVRVSNYSSLPDECV